MGAISSHSEVIRIDDPSGAACAEASKARCIIENNVHEHNSRLLTPVDPGPIESTLSFEEANEVAASLLRDLAIPTADRSLGPRLPSLTVIPVETQNQPHLKPFNACRTHWLARAMSHDSAGENGVAPAEPETSDRWFADRKPAASNGKGSLTASLEQWVSDPGRDRCTCLVPVPLDSQFTLAATGAATTMQLESIYCKMLPPPLPSTCTGGAKYPGSSSHFELAPAAQSAVQVTAQQGAIDDTMAELLRPLLRQWLNDKMGRIMEQALTAELAENARS